MLLLELDDTAPIGCRPMDRLRGCETVSLVLEELYAGVASAEIEEDGTIQVRSAG